MIGQHTGGVLNQQVTISDDDIVEVIVNGGDITVEAGEVVASDPDVDAARLGNGI